MSVLTKRIWDFLRAGNEFSSHVSSVTSSSALYFHSHAFRALFSQSSEAAATVNTQVRLQIWSYLMTISDSKEKQPVANEGEQIVLSLALCSSGFRVQCLKLHASRLFEWNMRFCVMPCTSLHLHVSFFCTELEASTHFCGTSEDLLY